MNTPPDPCPFSDVAELRACVHAFVVGVQAGGPAVALQLAKKLGEPALGRPLTEPEALACLVAIATVFGPEATEDDAFGAVCRFLAELRSGAAAVMHNFLGTHPRGRGRLVDPSLVARFAPPEATAIASRVLPVEPPADAFATDIGAVIAGAEIPAGNYSTREIVDMINTRSPTHTAHESPDGITVTPRAVGSMSSIVVRH